MVLIFMLATLLVCHLVGDFTLQNEWMQAKGRSSYVCTVHVACYMLPFVVACLFGPVPAWALPLIAVQHWVQDRYALARVWMKWMGTSDERAWPVGPLCNDQALHVAWLGIVAWLQP